MRKHIETTNRLSIRNDRGADKLSSIEDIRQVLQVFPVSRYHRKAYPGSVICGDRIERRVHSRCPFVTGNFKKLGPTYSIDRSRRRVFFRVRSVDLFDIGHIHNEICAKLFGEYYRVKIS